MPFVCPDCARPTLEIAASLELAADAWWDEIALQVLACSHCDFRGAAVYEESRRGALDSEAVNHRGHRLAAWRVSALTAAIAACPEPRNPGCQCAAHKAWGRSDGAGRWVGVQESEGAFPLVPAW